MNWYVVVIGGDEAVARAPKNILQYGVIYIIEDGTWPFIHLFI